MCDLCAAVLCSVVRLPSSSSNIPRVGGHARLRESFVKLPRVRRHCDQERGCARARVSSQPGGSLRRHSSRWGRRMCAQSRPVCQVRLWPAALRHALPSPFLSPDVERMPRVFPPADRVAVVTPRTCSRCRLILTGGEGAADSARVCRPRKTLQKPGVWAADGDQRRASVTVSKGAWLAPPERSL